MEIKKGLDVSTDDFWYDLSWGGYLRPEDICEHPEDALRVKAAVKVLIEFDESCQEQIEGFIQ